ncbi:hypothetical protein B0O80DRAFT_501454 [Mortierella sp. GBAus27b]|nr:hypothetical protein B0O80DRAFT_501454 [Mortierella sp. GBAus27b]
MEELHKQCLQRTHEGDITLSEWAKLGVKITAKQLDAPWTGAVHFLLKMAHQVKAETQDATDTLERAIQSKRKMRQGGTPFFSKQRVANLDVIIWTRKDFNLENECREERSAQTPECSGQESLRLQKGLIVEVLREIREAEGLILEDRVTNGIVAVQEAVDRAGSLAKLNKLLELRRT